MSKPWAAHPKERCMDKGEKDKNSDFLQSKPHSSAHSSHFSFHSTEAASSCKRTQFQPLFLNVRTMRLTGGRWDKMRKRASIKKHLESTCPSPDVWQGRQTLRIRAVHSPLGKASSHPSGTSAVSSFLGYNSACFWPYLFSLWPYLFFCLEHCIMPWSSCTKNRAQRPQNCSVRIRRWVSHCPCFSEFRISASALCTST